MASKLKIFSMYLTEEQREYLRTKAKSLNMKSALLLRIILENHIEREKQPVIRQRGKLL